MPPGRGNGAAVCESAGEVRLVLSQPRARRLCSAANMDHMQLEEAVMSRHGRDARVLYGLTLKASLLLSLAILPHRHQRFGGSRGGWWADAGT